MEESLNTTNKDSFESLTKEDLEELEKKPKTKADRIKDKIIIFMPFIMAILAFLEYIYWPHDPSREATAIYSYFILIQAGILLVFALVPCLIRKFSENSGIKLHF